MYISRKRKVVCSDRKQIRVCLDWREQEESSRDECIDETKIHILRQGKTNLKHKLLLCPSASSLPTSVHVHLHYVFTRPPQYLLSHRNQFFSFWRQPCNSLEDNIPFLMLEGVTMTHHSPCTCRRLWWTSWTRPLYHFP